MIVGMWMAREIVTVEPATHLADAARVMVQHKIRRLPVASKQDNERRLLGIVSATDLYRAYPPDRNPFAAVTLDTPHADLAVDRIMTRQVRTTTAETPIEDAAKIMRESKIGALPVLRGSELVGLITESDIFRAFISLFSDHSRGARITFSTAPNIDVFEMLAQETRRHKVRVLSLVSSQWGEQVLSVVRIAGTEVDQVLDELWQSGNRPLNVLRWP